MLHRYTDQERTVVKSNYGKNPMLGVADAACRQFDSQLQNISLWPEELFVWATAIMDDVKEKGDEYMSRIGDLWKDHYRLLRGLDKSVPAEELQLTASLILYIPTLMLQTSKDSVHRYMGKQMLDSVSLNYESWEETFTALAARCNRLSAAMGEWTNGFMALENDLYMSDQIAELLEPMISGELHDSCGGNTYVTVQSGGEYVAQKTVERAIGKIESGGTGFVESENKEDNGRRG